MLMDERLLNLKGIVEKDLLLNQDFLNPCEIYKTIKPNCGFYAIKVNDKNIFDDTFKTYIDNHCIVYIGIAKSNNLNKRVRQEIHVGTNGNFFRYLGSILGKKAIVGSNNLQNNNFKFEDSDRLFIRKFIIENFTISFMYFPYAINDDGKYDLCEIESLLINDYCPLFNKDHNPNFCHKVKIMRDANLTLARKRE